ncbi:protein C3orf33 homolog [Rhodnius prolixus]
MQRGADTTWKVSSEDVDRHWFEKFANLLEQNIRGVQLGIYAVAFCGLGIAIRSVRPFKKFTSPSQIPSTFFENNIKLNGKVLSIDVTSRPLLLVDHYPIMGSKWRSVGPLLPVEIESLNISQNGVCWLQTIVKNSNIEFTLLKRNPDSVSCIVSMKNRNVAKHLLSLGFASVSPFNFELRFLATYTKYYAELLKAEDRAEKMGFGMWTMPSNKYSISELLRKVPLLFRTVPWSTVQLLKFKL